MIKTKSVYDSAEETDGERILVSRYWPRSLSKERLFLTEHLKDMAPSVELLRDWKKRDISWESYKKRYHQEMTAQLGKIKELAKRANSRTITLLCFEREKNPFCHRYLLKGLIEKYRKVRT